MVKSGTMQNGTAAPYDFSISTLLSDAWQGQKGFKTTFWGGLAYTFLLLILFSILFAIIETIAISSGMSKDTMQQVTNIAVTLFMLPMIVGLLMLGVHRAVNMPVQAKQVFSYWGKFWPILGVYIVQNIIVVLVGFVLGIFWGIAMAASSLLVKAMCGVIALIMAAVFVYLTIGYTFALLLKADKNLSIWGALEASRKAVTQHWFKVFGTYILMGILAGLSVFPGIILWIWVIPMMYIVLGSLYSTMFGVEIK